MSAALRGAAGPDPTTVAATPVQGVALLWALPRWLAAAAAAAGAGAIVAHSAWFLARFSWTTLYGDQWRIYADYLRTPLPDALLLVQNGHRPVFPGLLYLLDFFVLGAHNRLLLAAATACLLAFLAALSWWILERRDLDAALRIGLVAALWASQLWLANFRVLAHGNGGLHAYPVFLLLLVAVWAMDRRSRAGTGWTVLAAAAAFVATFTYSFGVVLWPVLVLAVLLLRLPWRDGALVMGGGVATLVLYLRVLPETQAVGAGRPRLAELPADGAIWLANPVRHAWWGIREGVVDDTRVGVYLAVGAALAALGILVVLVALLRRPALRRLELWTVCAVAFSLGCALLVAYGRSGYFDALPGQRLAPRYVPWACVLWVGLLLAGGLAASRLRRGRRPAQLTLGVVAAAAVLALWPAQELYGLVLRLSTASIREAALAVAVGVDNEANDGILWPGVGDIDLVAEHLEAEGKGMFDSPAARAAGRRLAGSPTEEGTICGLLRPVEEIPDGSGTALRFSGWAAEPESGRPPDHLLVTDGSGIVRGGALFTSRAAEGGVPIEGVRDLAGFTGFVDDHRAGEAYRLVAVTETGGLVDLGALAPAGRDLCAPAP